MATRLTCFLSGEHADIVETATVLHAKGIATAYIPGSALHVDEFPDYCPQAQTGVAPDFLIELTLADVSTKIQRLQAFQALRSPQSLILGCSVTVSATEQASLLNNDSELIGFSYLPGQFSRKLLELAPTPYTSRQAISRVEDLAIRLAMEVSVVQDRVGMVLPRVVVALVNEAFFAVMEGAAEPRDIDTAMVLGTSYPQGPIAWANAIGLLNVVAVLDALYKDTGEDRYRVAPLLRQLARAKSA